MSYRLFLLAALLAPAVAMAAQDPPADDHPRVRAPDLGKADWWLNTDRPVAIKDLKGQVVILDFWTYCCINCMHVFPDLKFLEEKYKDQALVVIGVHSGKFDQEKDAGHIRSAVLRHNITHPVAVDSDYEIWRSYGVHAWPTVVVIDPEGYVIGGVSGEGHRDTLDRAVQRLLEIHGRKGTLGKHITFKTERETFQSGVLEFPGKVLADAKGKRLFVADTNHHRVLVSDLDGKMTQVIGTGSVGLRDGPIKQAQFHQPQGMALSDDGNTLYVADTENHAVRVLDLTARVVKTIAGTGSQARNVRASGGFGPRTDLSSPWDLARVGDRLYIAMAGSHQIWTLDLNSSQVRLFAGSGREAAIDGEPAHAAFAQPSGLATDGKTLYVADSEASTIRAVGLDENGGVASVAGSNDLFGFGLKDGAAGEARFQHPLGVALDESATTLYVADTFNGSIRTIDLKSRQVKTWLKSGNEGAGIDALALSEPGGLSLAGGVLYVADTNHHRIVAVDVATKKSRVLKFVLP
jgi:DNA-binding beta-propeller fold protein YncE